MTTPTRQQVLQRAAAQASATLASRSEILPPLPSVADLTAAARSEYQHGISAFHRSLMHALRCGELLQQIKDAVGHGGWGDWIRANKWIGERTAQAYLLIARGRPVLEAKSADFADLTIEGALKLISESRKPNSPAVLAPPKTAAESQAVQTLRRTWEKASIEERRSFARRPSVQEAVRELAYVPEPVQPHSGGAEGDKFVIDLSVTGTPLNSPLLWALERTIAEFKQANPAVDQQTIVSTVNRLLGILRQEQP